MPIPSVGIFSRSSDTHALTVLAALKSSGGVNAYFFAVDSLHGTGVLHWSSVDANLAVLPDYLESRPVRVSDLDAIWWRRSPTFQLGTEVLAEPHHVELVDSDCNAAIVGIALSNSSGRWISEPSNTAAAENKIVQLTAARAAGLTIPKTLVTQNPEKLKQFSNSFSGPIVVKCLRGGPNFSTPTSFFKTELVSRTASIQASPAIYQEYISGTTHLRIHCFGTSTYTAAIISDSLDWRGDLNVPFAAYRLPDNVQSQVMEVLNRLGLKMGIVDMKLTPGGDFVWLEVNPQGQFLFVEALVPELRLLEKFVEFFRGEAFAHAKSRKH